MSLLTFEISTKAVAYRQRLRLAFCIKVVRTKDASIVLRPFLKPNCSGPKNSFSSTILVMMVHILTVMSLNMFEGTVMGR